MKKIVAAVVTACLAAFALVGAFEEIHRRAGVNAANGFGRRGERG